MKFVSVRDLRNQAADVWRDLADDEIVLTANGRPRALMTRIDDVDLEPMLREIRLARARIALARLQAQARASGAAGMDDGAIDDLVREVREERGH